MALDGRIDDLLSKLYFGDGGAAFSPNASVLMRYAREEIKRDPELSGLKLSLKNVQEFLANQKGFGEVNQTVRLPLKRFARRIMVSSSGYVSIQVDTAYMNRVPRRLNVNFLYVFVNMLSRKTFLWPATVLNSDSASRALEDAVAFYGGRIDVLESDQGNQPFTVLLIKGFASHLFAFKVPSFVENSTPPASTSE